MTFGYNWTAFDVPYTPDVQNTQLIASVLMHKQAEFDAAYKGLKGLQRQALGINFINKGEQAKIDAFNKEVNDVFSSGEFGDLSDTATVQKYGALFDRIGKDTTLISRYRDDVAYQQQLRAVEEKRLSKNPAQAGFGAVNYDNYLNRLQEYANMDLSSPQAQGYTVRPYTDYVDIHRELGERMKQVPIKKFSTTTLENGYKITRYHEGRDPDAVKALVDEYLATRGVTQVAENAEYAYRRTQGDPSVQERFYQDYYDQISNARMATSNRLAKVQEDLQKAPASSAAALATEQARLESQLSDLDSKLLDPATFWSRDRDAIVNNIAEVASTDLSLAAVQAYGGFAVTEKVEADATYLEFAKMNQRAQEFSIREQRERDELALKAKGDGSNSSKKSLTAGEEARLQGMSYISASDPTHIDFVSTMEAAQGTLTKLYAHQSNYLEDGITTGDTKWSAEQVGLEMLIDHKALDANPYYGESPYVRAHKKAIDYLYAEQPALAEYAGKRPTSDYEWDRLKEANNWVRARVQQMMTTPKDREEAQYINHLQDVQANAQSMQEFMADANASGNPSDYIKNKQNIKIYPNAVYDFDIPEDAGKSEKERVVEMENRFRPIFENYLDVPAAEYTTTSEMTKDEWYTSFSNPDRVRGIPYGQVRKVESGPDGTLKVFFKPEAFETVTKGDEKSPSKSGILSSDGAYFMVKQPGKYVKVTRDEIASRGYLEFKAGEFNSINWSNQLGITVGAKPQKRWEVTRDGQSVPFEVKRSVTSGKIQMRVLEGPWQEFPTSDVSAVIAQARALIAQNTAAEISK